MPPLRGFSDNPLLSKDDLVLASESFLKPLLPYFSSGHARVKVPVESGAHFDETAAQLEGFARPLWVVSVLLSDAELCNGSGAGISYLQLWVDGLREGVNPSSPEYWGSIGDWDQRMVEAEILSFALLTAPDKFYHPLEDDSKRHLAIWLMGINGKVMPENNWRWFRVLSNLALIKVCGQDRGDLWGYIEEDLATLESFYIDDGWSSDGVWRSSDDDSELNSTRGRHADYYSGSFAIQFSQMLYAKYAHDLDPERAVLFQDRARSFIRGFWAYFDTKGAAIPFGRSLTYRFAMGAFYAAFAYTGLCDDSEQLLSHGSVKGMLLRHLRWWADHSHNIFSSDGTLNLGYMYPNMYLCEDYNSPQSPYWALKALIIAGMSSESAFWQSNELPHPLSGVTTVTQEEAGTISVVKAARQIICNHQYGNHHFLLSSGQFCVWPMKASAAKYAKFAYSSAFGFSVPTGTLLTQIAPDNTLALSHNNGESWSVRWKSLGETAFVTVQVQTTETHALVSRWKPWGDIDVEVETTLISPCSEWPDWHLRIHRIRRKSTILGKEIHLSSVEGGFAINGCSQSTGRALRGSRSRAQPDSLPEPLTFQTDGGILEAPFSSLVVSKPGAVGVVDLSPKNTFETHLRAEALKVDPNTNLVATRTLIPTLKRQTKLKDDSVVFATGVFAFAGDPQQLSRSQLAERWMKRPRVQWLSNGDFRL